MNIPRHPFLWRDRLGRASLAFGACTLLFITQGGRIASAKPAAEAETPALNLPLFAPSLDLPAPAIPSVVAPNITPKQPSSTAVDSQSAAARHGYEIKVRDFRRNRALHTSHSERIDFVEALIHLERYDEAIEELDAIEEKFPDAYINAHLRGIACELSGNLPSAGRWFAEALKRDPDAQEGTGWLRVAMIEARLALEKDSDWLSSHSVLDGCASRSETELIRAVEIQVEGRLDFFNANDPVLADLYFQIGARMGSHEERNRFFALSLEVGTLRRDDIEEQLALRARVPSHSGSH